VRDLGEACTLQSSLRMPRLFGCALALASLLAFERNARAAEESSTEEAAPTERRSFVAGNMMGLPFGRVAADVGSELGPHLVPVAPLHLQATPAMGSKATKSALTGYGAELGARLYTNARAPAGGFIGISALAGRYNESKELFGQSKADIFSYGAAVDVGWSFILDNGLVITVGAGLHKRWAQESRVVSPRTDDIVDDTPEPTNTMVYGFTKGFGPRVLAQLGYAF